MARPIGIDLFAGAGGMSLGFEQAGFDVKVAVEIDPIHCVTHKFNFPDCAIISKSVKEISAAEIRKAGGIGDATIDCVFGGPPCQGFSLIGHRTLDDPRNSLVLEFVRLVSELGARSFVFENVKGLTVGRHKAFLKELVETFEAVGYEVQLPPRVLNAASYGVPQKRERLILFGVKKGEKLPTYPLPMTRFKGEADLVLAPAPTCAEALGDLPNAEGYADLRATDAVVSNKWGNPSAYAKELRCLTNDAWHFGHQRRWDPQVLTSSWRTEHSYISRQRFEETTPGEVEPISRFFRLAAGGLSNTLRAGTDGARGAFTSPRPIHYKYARCITVREMARLHGYPDWFRLHGTKWHGARQVGNSVPPPMARAIGASILRALGIRPVRSNKVKELGDEALLAMEMSEAAAYCGVKAPAQRRDRKSGAKKRSQTETERERLRNRRREAEHAELA
ncbi:DNA cytosine methyltransferase [Bradyrhizobium diazoefficiens]|uniref:Cytosine-specific methyltransferase n=1 Tax=Bradyrhizobium diazoefficiens TaxID=1355477 RepID=A0A810CFD4_9BRAD|nr:DNA cytosine methyltransferase [Bradyrhizobium diazoefficiens]WLA73823.1 DNA cytosine methyltransferase [Bradyrhizobium diazoefficiens]BCE18080.1 cytosine-specific methyltransferase [Bradyrhizobium diazoefficiens]BCE44333.1 cytosine-specific methyltransferase [Bradyrhizobium diazoefficiens]BCE87878.1 cytosine-specific methyltransferase [Bradyrhizobium diazoefficiens]BCF22808.1 cytosine-specific methyltransferase [Bradyrhizobium diazoefficiens]